MLLFCGRSVERVLGGRGIVILYLVGAYAAAAAQYAADPAQTVPMVGASGAISAVLGAYALLFGRNKVKVAHPGARHPPQRALARRGLDRPPDPGRPHLRDDRPQDRHRRPYRRLPRRPGCWPSRCSCSSGGGALGAGRSQAVFSLGREADRGPVRANAATASARSGRLMQIALDRSQPISRSSSRQASSSTPSATTVEAELVGHGDGRADQDRGCAGRRPWRR